MSKFDRLEDLFHFARDLSCDEQAAFVRSSCTGDPELARQLTALLKSDAELTGKVVNASVRQFEDETRL